MGEVGEAIPDKSTVDHISPIMITAASSIAIASNRNSSPVQQNGDVLKAVTASSTSDEPMIIDSDDDDSCDNQSDTKIGESINANGDVEISRDFYDEKFGSKDGLDEKDLIEEENCSDYEEDRKSVEKKSGNSTDNEESQDGRESGSPTSHDEIEDGEDAEEEDESSESTTNDSDSRSLSKGSETKNVSPETVGKLNGEAKSDEGAVVNLSDSDDDMESAEQNVQRRDNEVDPIALPVNVPISEPTTLRHNTTDSDGAVIIGSDSENEVEEQTEVNLLKQQNSQSQQPVEQILPQSQNIEKPQFSVTPQHMKQDEDQAPQQVQAQVQRMEQNNQQPPKIDDDDDDCVLIEDDSPTPSPAGVINRQQNSMVKVCDFASIGENHTSDDSQPPAKRQKTSFNPVPPLSQISQSPMSQITIKDARSLMPPGHNNAINPIVPGKEPTLVIIDTETNKTVSAAFPHNVAYPGNLRPQLITGQPSAQMAQISKNMPLQVNPPLPSIPTTSNANLLPGLTDDMFVLEAPSFIVPYIYEKPPSDNLRNIVTQIETKFDFNSCETEEQNVVDNIIAGDGQTADSAANPANAASKKKKRKHGSGDESWSECDDSADEEDEDDSGSETRTKVLIKEANDDIKTLSAAIKPIQISNSTNSTPTTNVIKQQIGENYFESPLGKFFMDIGAGLVQEFVQADLIRIQKRKLRRSLGKNITELERTVAALSGNLEASKKRNAAFKFNIKRCEFCNFKSESALAMAHHYETPHMNGVMYKCNFCSYEIRNSTEIVYHMEAMHNIKARLFKHLPYHQCPNCGFEDNGRAKLARHAPVCVKKFRPEVNLAPPHDWEAPAKIPRIKPRHGLVGTATAYQAMAAQAAAQKAALASIQQQHQQAQQARNLQAAMVNNNVNKNVVRGRPQTVTKTSPNGGTVLRGTTVPAIRSPMPTGMVMPNNYQIAAGQLIQVSGSGLAILPTSQNTLTLQTANAAGSKKNQPISGQPSISITPLPRQTTNMHQGQSSPSSSNKLPPPGVKPGQIPPGNKNQFVICEICDGYIKDLEQLRNHMQWMHKVKIHPKMIYNRPPLNCQKCQFRFFTDQGLERHLLGSHGLVTSSMQEAANKGKDAGRCPVCGRMYQWKLLNHVSRDHHMTLKPAHLSYKCTVCTATFGMYKQFETHVYTAHSTVAKKAMDGKKSNSTNSGIGNSSSGHMMPNRSGLSSSNDSLLKPLKINDEITIIPQPAAKNRASMHPIESHVID